MTTGNDRVDEMVDAMLSTDPFVSAPIVAAAGGSLFERAQREWHAGGEFRVDVIDADHIRLIPVGVTARHKPKDEPQYSEKLTDTAGRRIGHQLSRFVALAAFRIADGLASGGRIADVPPDEMEAYEDLVRAIDRELAARGNA